MTERHSFHTPRFQRPSCKSQSHKLCNHPHSARNRTRAPHQRGTKGMTHKTRVRSPSIRCGNFQPRSRLRSRCMHQYSCMSTQIEICQHRSHAGKPRMCQRSHHHSFSCIRQHCSHRNLGRGPCLNLACTDLCRKGSRSLCWSGHCLYHS